MIAFSCTHCQSKLKVKDELAGKRIRCPHCQDVQEVPLPSQGAATRNAADSRAQTSVPEDARLPPSPRSRSVADEATLPPGTSRVPGPTLTHQASDHEPADSETRKVVRAGSVYEVEAEIARGGMGAIMRAVDQDIRREVAVKFLLNRADERQKTRFIEEAQITGQLEHPNIVPIHQLGVHEDGRCFFSMKMVKGRSLTEILKEQDEPGASATGGDYTLRRLLNIFSSICNALAYAHSRQVIHRDLKPANIMVGDFGEVYVMDWGLAKVLGREETAEPRSEASNKPSASKVATSRAVDSNLTQAGAIMGTPAYMPPEQATGEAGAVDQRSDIYSLGAILYEILTLSPPVGRGGDQLAVLMRVVDGAITPPEKQAPERARQGLIPPELSAVALKALAKNPADRYQSVQALQRDIQLFLEGRSVSAKQDSAWVMFKKLVKRNKGVSVGMAIALLVLLGSLGFILNAWHETGVAYAAYQKEQEQRLKQGRDSIPSFLTAARLLVDKRDFDAARAQVRVALDFDPEHTEVRNLRGQLALVAQDFAQAQKDLEAHARQRPDDLLTRDLLEWIPRAKPNDINSQLLLAEIFSRHLAYALADGALQALGENAQAVRQKLLTLYQQRLDKAWPGKGTLLTLNSGKGTFHLDLAGFKELTDLSPLRDLPLTSLNLRFCVQLQDLEPLKGMPLTVLDLRDCPQVRDLGPLKGMPLTSLSLRACPEVRDLGPLKGMPLTSLDLSGCSLVRDLEPLKGMPLTSLNLYRCSQVRDLDPLKGMPLTWLTLQYCQIFDLGPLKGMPLTSLVISGCSQVRDLEPLKGMKLTSLNLGENAQVRDLEPLKDMPLTSLHLYELQVRDLGPLKGMKLTSLDLRACTQVRDLGPLKGMPLQALSISGTGVTHLTPLQGMKLEDMSLTPKLITEGLDILRRMESLKTIGVSPAAPLPAAEFWKKHAAGEFNK